MARLASKHDMMRRIEVLEGENKRLRDQLTERNRVIEIVRQSAPVNIMAAERRINEEQMRGGKG